jgi:hypothetical protein
MRSGSTADAREMRVKLSSRRNPMDWGAVRFWVGFPEVYDVIAISPHTMLGVPQAGTDFLLLTRRSFSAGWSANLDANAEPEVERLFEKT